MIGKHQKFFGLVVVTASFLVVTGCEKEATITGSDGQVMTLRTAQPAPDDFEAWDFVWKGPKRGLNVDLEMTVIQPDGKEYARQGFAAYPGKSDGIQSSFSPGFAGGDPKVFFRQPIRLSFRVEKDSLSFPPAEIKLFKFRFFKKEPNGDVDWRKPFQTVDAVAE